MWASMETFSTTDKLTFCHFMKLKTHFPSLWLPGRPVLPKNEFFFSTSQPHKNSELRTGCKTSWMQGPVPTPCWVPSTASLTHRHLSSIAVCPENKSHFHKPCGVVYKLIKAFLWYLEIQLFNPTSYLFLLLTSKSTKKIYFLHWLCS